MPAETANPILSVSGLNVFYGPIQAVYGASFEVETGSIVTLLGANGAGKTTTLRALAGFLPARDVEIRFKGNHLSRMSASARVAKGMALVPDNRELFRTLTVNDNLRAGGYRQSRSEVRHEIERVFTYFPVLAERRNQTAGALSGGQAQMLAIGRALMAKPSLLLLDEPSQGLAPKVVSELFTLLPRMVEEEKLSILLVEQNAAMALNVAQHGYVLVNGRLELEGSTESLRQDSTIKRLYLGG